MSNRVIERAGAPITGTVDATIVAPLGQQVMADSVAVVIASDQVAVATKGLRVARAVYRASLILDPAGAFTATAPYAIPDGVKKVMFYATYTRGAAGGYPQFKVQFGNGTEVAEDILVSTTITVAATETGSVPFYQSRLYGPIPSAGAAIVYAIRVDVTGGPTTVALQAAELGVTGTPGTLAIALTGSY